MTSSWVVKCESIKDPELRLQFNLRSTDIMTANMQVKQIVSRLYPEFHSKTGSQYTYYLVERKNYG